MLSTLLLVFGLGTIIGTMILGKIEDNCNKPKQEKTEVLERPTLPEIYKTNKINWQKVIIITICLLFFLWWVLVEVDTGFTKQ